MNNSNDLLERIKKPIHVRSEELPERPMMLLHSLSNPNIILVNQVLVDVVPEIEEPTYGYVNEDNKESLLTDVLASSNLIRDFVYKKFLPLTLGYEDAENKILEELDSIFEGKAQVTIEPLRKIILRAQTLCAVEFVVQTLGLTKAQSRKIVETYFNETLERIRYNGNNRQHSI